MGAEYQRWLADPDVLQILEAHNAHELDGSQQSALERLMATTLRANSMPLKQYKTVAKTLVPPVRNVKEVTFMVDCLKATARDGRRWTNAGTDPQVYVGYSHRSGIDTPTR